MFTGIVQGVGRLHGRRGHALEVENPAEIQERLSVGASVAVNGVCLTVVAAANGVFGAKHMAESVSSMHNIGLIRDALEKYRSAYGEYPPYLKDLVDNAMLPAGALYAPDRENQAYKYIRGQNPKMRGDNILVYEERPIHRDKCNVLRLGGQIETLTSEQLKKAVELTRLRVGED